MRFSILLLFLTISTFLSKAEETKLIVRAQTKGSSFRGSSVSGAQVVIRDHGNNRILAQGTTQSAVDINSGDLLDSRNKRDIGFPVSESAKFETALELSKPTLVDIEVLSPASKRNAHVIVSTAVWIIPGKHILGEGIVLEIPGFIVDILYPQVQQHISLRSLDDCKLRVRSHIGMMCGAPIEKGGISIESKVILKRNGEEVLEHELTRVSAEIFESTLRIGAIGHYEMTIYAYDPRTGNTGVEFRSFVLLP